MNNMEIETVLERVEYLKELAKSDSEQAHMFEDQLHDAVLKTIAEGNPNPMRMAKAALSTQSVKFMRWYA